MFCVWWRESHSHESTDNNPAHIEPCILAARKRSIYPSKNVIRASRAELNLKLGRGAEAEAEFRMILEHRGYSPLSVLYPLAHLGLARSAAMTGQTAESRRSYEALLELRKTADPDFPPLIEAKSEYSGIN